MGADREGEEEKGERRQRQRGIKRVKAAKVDSFNMPYGLVMDRSAGTTAKTHMGGGLAAWGNSQVAK